MAGASKKGGGMGHGKVVGHQSGGMTSTDIIDEHDLAAEMQGSNKLQGQDQERQHNERRTQPGSLDEDNAPSDSPKEEL